MENEPQIEVPINNDLEKRIAEAFEVFDHGGNKTVDVREVGTILRSLGKQLLIIRLILLYIILATIKCLFFARMLPYRGRNPRNPG